MTEASPFTTNDPGPSPELDITLDMVKRGLKVTPVWVLLCALIWGFAGAASGGYAIAIVLANFLLSAYMLAMAARISFGLLMGAALFGYLMRLGLIFLAVWIVRDESWISLYALAATIIVTHLGLLMWELKYVSTTLSSPGLKQTADKRTAAASQTTPTSDPAHTDAP